MKLIDDLLDNIDVYYVGKSQKDRVYSYIMAFFGLGAIIYLTTYDLTSGMYDKASKERTAIQKVIKDDKRYLKNNTTDDVLYAQTQNKTLKTLFAQTKDMTGYIELKIEDLAPLVYNETAWGAFIDSISDTARNNHIHMSKITNLYVDKKNKFGHVLDLELEFTGGFHNTLRFINTLEKTPLVVDIHDMKLKADETLVSTLKLAVWGISY